MVKRETSVMYGWTRSLETQQEISRNVVRLGLGAKHVGVFFFHTSHGRRPLCRSALVRQVAVEQELAALHFTMGICVTRLQGALHIVVVQDILRLFVPMSSVATEALVVKRAGLLGDARDNAVGAVISND
jgi:hypothetical protein